MSVLGYSASYFLPEYWSETPLYGEKIIPLLDYILSTDFSQADKLANAFHMVEDKYKNTANLPIGALEAIIDESGYGYVKDLLGDNEESIRLLVYLLVLIHQLKGTKLGIEVVLNLLKRDTSNMVQSVIGDPTILPSRDVTDFSITDYITYSGFTVDSEPFEILFQVRTSADFRAEQCIASCGMYGFYIGIGTNGQLILSLGSKARSSWDIANRSMSNSILLPNTNYYIKLTYDGYEYDLKVSTDNVKFTDYVVISNSTPTGIHSSIIYLGVDNSTGTVSKPFLGSINLAPFSLDVQNIVITEWFENFPLDPNSFPEDTFSVNADIDLGVANIDFFEKFAVFVSKYVYPTLTAFEAKFNFENNLTFLPYVRQKINYTAVGDVLPRIMYRVQEQGSSPVVMLDYTVLSKYGVRQDFEVLPEDVTFSIIPTPSNATVVITARGYTQSGNSITVPYDTKVTYEVSAPGYQTKTGSVVLLEDTNLNVLLDAVNG